MSEVPFKTDNVQVIENYADNSVEDERFDHDSLIDDAHVDGNDQDINSEEFLMYNESDDGLGDPPFGETTGDTTSSDMMKDVYWHGSVIKMYPLNYQKVFIVKLQLVACFLMFFVFGVNDQITGSLMPILTAHYQVSVGQVSRIFMVQTIGYVLASILNDKIHKLAGLRGVFVFCCVSCFLSFGILLSKPASLNAYIVCFLPIGFALGLVDSAGNVLIGNFEIHNTELLGILHGIYGVSAMLTPPLVTFFAENYQWNYFFYVPMIISLISIFVGLFGFWHETAVKYNYTTTIEDQEEAGNTESNANIDGNEESFESSALKVGETSLWVLIRNPIVFMNALFLVIYLGSEISTGSWIFTYLLRTKLDNKTRMAYVTSCYWFGFSVGRFTLGFVTKKYFRNTYRASLSYCYITLVLYTSFVLVGLINSSRLSYSILIAIIVFFIGLFMGPLFPNLNIVALELLPKKIHVAAVGLSIGLGGCGAATLPYLVGLALDNLGISLMPVLCWILVLLLTIVLALYPSFIKNHEDKL